MNAFLVFVGGGIGALLRFGISNLVKQLSILKFLKFPIATVLANLFACVIFAVFIYFLKDKINSSLFNSFILIGICGGLSTFSTFSYENFILIQQQEWLVLSLNILISVMLCAGVFYFIANWK